MSKQSVSMLRLAVRKLKEEKPSAEKQETVDDLEQAMADFENASSPKERAEAFRAALELAKS